MVSRTGTGGSGSTNVCSITFSFAPTIVYYFGTGTGIMYMQKNGTTYGTYGAYPSKLTTSFKEVYMMNDGSYYRPYVKTSSDSKTIYWYAVNNDYVSQCYNESGSVYYFLGVV